MHLQPLLTLLGLSLASTSLAQAADSKYTVVNCNLARQGSNLGQLPIFLAQMRRGYCSAARGEAFETGCIIPAGNQADVDTYRTQCKKDGKFVVSEQNVAYEAASDTAQCDEPSIFYDDE